MPRYRTSARHWKRIPETAALSRVEYVCGDSVYFRKEDATLFRYPGVVTKVAATMLMRLKTA